MAYAEVIGDPIAQSKSPVIHRYWLEQLGISGDYVRTRVRAAELAEFLGDRRGDPEWRGCNVTIPHKEAVIPLLDRVDQGAASIGAVNCIVPHGPELVGYNTDVDGVAAALEGTELSGRKVALIGAGGGARAVVAYLSERDVGRITVVARNPARARVLRELGQNIELEAISLEEGERAFENSAAIINASSLGMAGADAMPHALIEALQQHSAGATVFDLVTTPSETAFLSAGRAGGGRTVDGLTMLVGQAARAFDLFFGAPAPAPDRRLRDLLAADRLDSA